MKQKVTPPVIIGIVAVLALFMFGLYKVTVGRGNSNVVASADNAPAYAKQMQQGGTTAGGPPSGQAASYGQSYAEGAKYRNNSYNRPSGSQGSAPQMGGSMGGYSGSMGGGR